MNKRWLLAAGMVLIFAMPFAALAQDALIGFTISPPLRELNVSPGQSIDQTFDVTNTSAGAVTVYPLSKDFIASTDATSTSPQILETTPSDSATVVSPWIKFVQSSVEIAGGKTVSIHYTIAVPTDAAPGGHYGGVFVTTQQPTDTSTSNVGIDTLIGSLLLLTVAGTTHAAANVVEFTAVDDAGHKTSLFQQLPVHLRTTIANTGNIHVLPSGTITVTNMYGKQVLSQAFNQAGNRILPSSQHAFSQDITDSIGWGRFTASAVLALKASDGSTVPLNITTTFWLLPLVPMLIGLAILILLVVIFRLWLKRHDRQVQQPPVATPPIA